MKKRTKTKTTSPGNYFDALKKVEKKYGKEAIMLGGDDFSVSGPRLSTGSLSLDAALGGGGIPRGRVVEVFGPESSGKTTLALHLIANAQRKKGKGVAAFIDAEHALDPEYAKRIGVSIDDLIISQPDYGEQALSIAEILVKNRVPLIVIDSVAALVPQAELEGEMEDATIALQARLMSKAMRRLIGIVNKTNSIIIFINQTRARIGIGFSRGGQNITAGGKALRFYASIRIEIKRIGSGKEGTKIVSNETRAKVVKSKICVPFKVAEFRITFGKGIDKMEEIIHWAKKGKIVKVSGSSFKLGKKFKARGKVAFIEKLRESKKARKFLLKKVKAYIQEYYA